MKRYITVKGNIVVTVRKTNLGILPHEIESEHGNLGQVCNEDGTFSDYIMTEEEKKKIDDQEEIQELNEWLDLRRNIEHPDKAVKQARLLELLG